MKNGESQASFAACCRAAARLLPEMCINEHWGRGRGAKRAFHVNYTPKVRHGMRDALETTPAQHQQANKKENPISSSSQANYSKINTRSIFFR